MKRKVLPRRGYCVCWPDGSILCESHTRGGAINKAVKCTEDNWKSLQKAGFFTSCCELISVEHVNKRKI